MTNREASGMAWQADGLPRKRWPRNIGTSTWATVEAVPLDQSGFTTLEPRMYLGRTRGGAVYRVRFGDGQSYLFRVPLQNDSPLAKAINMVKERYPQISVDVAAKP